MKSSLITPLLILAAAALLAAAPPEGGFERTLPVSGAIELDLNTDAGGIHVNAVAGNAVKVRAILKGSRWPLRNEAEIERKIRELERNPPIEQTGSRIRVGYVQDKELLRGVSMRLEIETPADARLKATADSGGIRITGIRGPLDVQTDSGGIHVTAAGSEVRAQADSGGIHIQDVQGAVHARADSGGIEALNIAGAIDVQTDSGGINVSQTVAAPITARADSGGARVKLAQAGGYDVTLESGSGRISIPEMTVRGTISRHRAEGKVRGGGPLVDVKVDSGNVAVE